MKAHVILLNLLIAVKYETQQEQDDHNPGASYWFVIVATPLLVIRRPFESHG